MNELETKKQCDPAPPRRSRWWIPAALLLLVAAAVFWFSRTGRATAKTHEMSGEPPTVAAVKVTQGSLARAEVFDAEFRPYQEVELHARVGGFLEKLTVDVGDPVKAGAVIAVIEVPELNDDLDHANAVERRSKDELKRAEAAHEEAHISYTRLAAVDKSKPRLIAQQELDLTLAKDHEAEATAEAARQQISVAEADVRKLETMLKYSRITTPFDGVVTRRFIDPGALVQGGSGASTPIIRLSQNNRLRLVFPVPVSAVSRVKIGDPVNVNVQSLNRTFTAKVSRSTRKIETSTRTMEVEADIDNADLSLVPGMYASASLVIERHEGTLTLPVEAVSRQKTTTVWIINPQNEIEERLVKLGIETPAQVEITEGVKLNDIVMVGSRSQVHTGQRVTARLLKSKEQ